MPAQTTHYAAPGRFIADPHSITREPGGRQIDWSEVSEDYADATTSYKVLPAGKIMVELPSGKLVTRAERPGAEEAIGILETSASEGDKGAALTGYGLIIGGVIHDNLLPDAADAALTTYKMELDANGTGFAFRTYADDRAS